ncbi:hypothetical protein HJ01_01522 [Flavobacterium frigoris PS1]|uniref:Uncharacterized protein n=1 Tax=Flavobacterium frigoris (strain PS1) TaxID=1086011 RepID=H7FQZ9_FLAFP|nr:hypothetical protein HJ01_01522 [Flavobacterium frigoris PS1]
MKYQERGKREVIEKWVLLKNKTPVISRSFNHQSKNEQSIKLLFILN